MPSAPLTRGRFTASSRRHPCPVCGRLEDGDCRVRTDGLVLCHSVKPGTLKPGDPAPDNDAYRCVGEFTGGQSGTSFKPASEWKERKKRHPRTPGTTEYQYRTLGGDPLPPFRRTITETGKKDCRWSEALPCPEERVAPYRWEESIEVFEACPGYFLVVVKGEEKADALNRQIRRPVISIRSWTKPVAEKLKRFGSRVVLAPDNDLADLNGWYARACEDLPEARHLLVPSLGADWASPPDHGGEDVADWIKDKPTLSLDEVIAEVQAEPWKARREDWAEELAELESEIEDLSRTTDPTARNFRIAKLKSKYRGAFNQVLEMLLNPPQRPEDVIITGRELMEDTEVGVPVVEGIVYRRGLTIISGETGAGKTTMGYSFALSMAEAEAWAGEFPTAQGPVVFLSYDEGRSSAKNRLKTMGATEKQIDNILVWAGYRTSQIEQLYEWLLKNPEVRTVIIDALFSTYDGGKSIKDPDFALALYRYNMIAEETDTAIIGLHHLNGGDGNAESLDRVFGSRYIIASCCDAWNLTRPDEKNPELFRLTCIKGRNCEQFRQIDLVGDIHDRSFTYSCEPTSLDLTPTGRRTSADKVLLFLKGRAEEGALVAEIVAGTGLGDKTVKTALGELNRGGQTEKHKEYTPGKGGKPPWRHWVAGMRRAEEKGVA